MCANFRYCDILYMPLTTLIGFIFSCCSKSYCIIKVIGECITCKCRGGLTSHIFRKMESSDSQGATREPCLSLPLQTNDSVDLASTYYFFQDRTFDHSYIAETVCKMCELSFKGINSRLNPWYRLKQAFLPVPCQKPGVSSDCLA